MSSVEKTQGTQAKGQGSKFYFLGLACMLTFWGIFTFSGAIAPQFFASPWDTVSELAALLLQGNVLSDAATSIARLFAGFILAMAVAIPVGILSGSSRKLSNFFEPLLSLFRYIPSAAIVPISILWLGLGEEQKYFIVFFGTLPFATLYISNAAASIEKEYLYVAYSLGASWHDALIKVVFPKILPDLVEIIRIELGAAWAIVIMAEVVSATSGLGHRLILAQRFLHTGELFGLLLLTLLIGLVMDKSLRFANASLFGWAEKNRVI